MLHMLFEANPLGVGLRRPDDFFRISSDGNHIEFLRPRDGRIDQAKSGLFTLALQLSGFRFPVTAIGGNPSIRKPYDAGYFLVDAGGVLFRMQMQNATPSCSRLGAIVPEHIRYIFVKEHHRRQFYGFIISDKAVYAIMQHNGSLRQLPVEDFDPDTLNMTIWSDLLHTSIVTRRAGRLVRTETRATALSPDFDVIRRFNLPPPTRAT
jgi:hypothetical protein